jgi:hypothetical protein
MTCQKDELHLTEKKPRKHNNFQEMSVQERSFHPSVRWILLPRRSPQTKETRARTWFKARAGTCEGRSKGTGQPPAVLCKQIDITSQRPSIQRSPSPFNSLPPPTTAASHRSSIFEDPRSFYPTFVLQLLIPTRQGLH